MSRPLFQIPPILRAPDALLPRFRTLLLLAATAFLGGVLQAAEPRDKPTAPPPSPTAIAPGVTVKLTRDVPLRFLEKTLRTGHEGETFRVLEVRAASLQVFVGVEQAGRLIAVSVPADAVAVDKKAATPKEIELGDDLFANRIPVLKIRISNEGMEKLRKDPRAYVNATLEEKGGPTLESVGVKLKGSVGSFKPIDERPGFSINTAKFKGKDRFHGLSKFQLNNGNQDGTYLNELLCGRIARKAGVPASRCTHAVVTLNDRFLGSYVLKEGFRDELIGSFFARTDGHLYDGGFVADIRKEMEVDRGDEGNRERLDELVQAIAEPNPALQTAKVEKMIDVEAYLRYLVLENILCHWDGYSFNRNNYRMYENPDTGRFHFFLHGMDQTLGDPNWSLWRAPQASVGVILWRKPEVRARYEALAKEICETVLFPGEWPEKTMQMGNRLKTALAAANPDAAKAYEGLIPQARDRIRARIDSLKKQLKSGNPFKKFETDSVIALAPFEWVAQAENAQADPADFENRQCLHIKATGDAKGSWRLPVFLPKGVYRFDALLRATGVEKIEDPSGEGVGLRISGASRQGKNAFSGELPWTKVSFEFESNGAEQTLVAELRAKAGELWIDRNSLRLNKLR
ncbi:MAG: hypothetical protein RLZZ244_1602 [Verrucomicrobiota bacterium]